MTPQGRTKTVHSLAGRNLHASKHCFGESFTLVVTRSAIDSLVRLCKQQHLQQNEAARRSLLAGTPQLVR